MTLLLALASMAGCGSPGSPAAPSLNLPAPVSDLTAVRVANSVHLSWSMPTRTTDRLPIKHQVAVEICRGIENSPCSPLTTLPLSPGYPGTYVDALPEDLTRGANRLLVYQVYLRNHAGKSAGPSNSTFAASGLAPATLAGLTAEARRDGVLLSWHPVTQTEENQEVKNQEAIVFRIHRILESAAKPAKAPQPQSVAIAPSHTAGEPATPASENLEIHPQPGVDPGHAMDITAEMNQKYRYDVLRVAHIALSGHNLELLGQPGEPVAITTTDVFPPAVPHGLVAAADDAGGAIDLSWEPDTDNDLAGYRVYRRDPGSPLPAERISPGESPLSDPAFRDTHAERGHTYAYSVTAIDHGGNESAHSPETMETLSNP